MMYPKRYDMMKKEKAPKPMLESGSGHSMKRMKDSMGMPKKKKMK